MLPVNGLYGHVQRNNARSVVLFAAFFLLFECLVGVVAFSRYAQTRGMEIAITSLQSRITTNLDKAQKNEAPTKVANPARGVETLYQIPFVRSFYASLWWQTLIGVGCWLFVAWLFLKYAVTKATRASRITRREEPRLYNLVENLTIVAGMPMPQIFVMQTRAMNAYAAGLTPTSALIAISRGMLDELNDDELQAVLAHELMHIKNCDTRLVAIASLFSGILVRSAWMTVEPFIKIRMIVTLVVMLPFIGLLFWLSLALVLWGCGAVVLGGWLVRHSLSEARDFIADAGAVELTKNPQALASALRKVEGRETLEGVDVTIDAMLFASAAGGPLSSHPSPRARIAALNAAAPGLAPAEDVEAAAERQKDITWAAVKTAARRSPKWVSHPYVLFPACVLALGATCAVASVVDPLLLTVMTGMTRATLTGRTPPELERAFGMPEGSMMSTFQLRARDQQIALSRKQAANCFPLDAPDYQPGSAPFTPVPTDDEAMRNERAICAPTWTACSSRGAERMCWRPRCVTVRRRDARARASIPTRTLSKPI